MPSFSSSVKTALDSSYVPLIALPATVPWSATAWMVGSGMVFTVCGATRSSTYMVSG